MLTLDINSLPPNPLNTKPPNLVELQSATSMALLCSCFLLSVVCQLFLLKFADRCSITGLMLREEEVHHEQRNTLFLVK
jgi:hypothetical protein